ncbi:UNC9-like protein, partial [Mya arenaria]
YFRVTSIVGGWTSWNKLRGNDDDDWVDRLSHIYTVVLLIIFALFTGGGQYAGDPIQCWCPAHFTGSYVAYTKSYCWIKNTYYLPMQDTIHPNNDTHHQNELTYYQWIPLILLFMAFLFKFPSFIWRMLAGYSGINMGKLVEMAGSTQVADQKKRNQTVEHICLYLDRWLEANRQYHYNIIVRMRQRASKFLFLCNKREGTFLTGLYLLIKALYVVNVICHFFLLNAFLGGFFEMWGFEAINSLANEAVTKESRRFPRVTLCDFKIRQLQNIQCVLPINLFNEKIFTFLWFWFVLVAVVTCASFLMWFWRTIFRRNRVTIVKKYLKINDNFQAGDKKLCKRFADQYLRDDGIFLLRIIERNTNDILMTDLVSKMWEIYRNKPMIRKELEGGEPNGDTYA